ncbi:hypothetical protein [Candidatus Anaplasma sp. TIGMIC]|uniref:hypothetical protein n=1 Tax=Candidatus Anaplasma sp. TIGMIC TaxID=3020713 RepID=UPI00232BEB5C|nr:hypothetical protein [Candidatus Anaplasma sp. TIGMIC]
MIEIAISSHCHLCRDILFLALFKAASNPTNYIGSEKPGDYARLKLSYIAHCGA